MDITNGNYGGLDTHRCNWVKDKKYIDCLNWFQRIKFIKNFLNHNEDFIIPHFLAVYSMVRFFHICSYLINNVSRDVPSNLSMKQRILWNVEHLANQKRDCWSCIIAYLENSMVRGKRRHKDIDCTKIGQLKLVSIFIFITMFYEYIKWQNRSPLQITS